MIHQNQPPGGKVFKSISQRENVQKQLKNGTGMEAN